MNDVLEEVTTIVLRSIRKTPADLTITAKSALIEELGLDSPRLVDVVLDLEDRYGISISEAESQSATTVADLVEIVEKKKTIR